MGGKRVRDAGQQRGEPTDGRRLVCEVDIERWGAEPGDAVREQRRPGTKGARELGRGEGVGERVQIADPALEEERGVGKTDAEPLVRHGALRQVLDRRAQLGERLLLHDFIGPPEREHVEAQTPPLQLQQLLEHEGLREPRKAVDEHDEVR